MTFKYYDKPEVFTGFRDKETTCNICEQERICFEAEGFQGTEDLESVCPDCLSSGRLNDKDVFTCQGDFEELKRQLKVLNPTLAELEIENIAQQKTTELEKTTPHLITWQDWMWPCADGDYCKFIGFGSKPLYKSLATNLDTEDFFKNTFYENDSYIDYLWKEALPNKEIKNYEDSNKYGTLFYVFKSLNSDKILTIWDCD